MSQKPGSTDREGYLYHQPAFPVEGKKYHRNDNFDRLKILLEEQDWWHKNVLDLGCNVGFFTIRLALEGARVVGVDTDTDALKVGEDQAREYRVEDAIFTAPFDDQPYAKDKDVLLALSVLPWIYETASDPDKTLAQLFKAPIAYVELPYPPDGRAHVPGVTDDETAQAFLEQWYPNVTKIATTHDMTDGVIRERSLFKCSRGVAEEKQIVIGSQCLVEIDDCVVKKTRREGKTYDPIREAVFLDRLAKYDIAPKTLHVSENEVITSRIMGMPITSENASRHELGTGLGRILKALRLEGISHNDIRPNNLILGIDGRVYIVDFGWATWSHEPKLVGVNPVYGGKDDEESVSKVLSTCLKLGL